MQHQHGGDVEGYLRRFGREPLDFSANISPLGLPEGVRRAAAEALGRADEYPDPQCRRLREAIAGKTGLRPGQLVCGCGAADLIYRLALARRPARALVTAPGFFEYEAALATVGCETAFFELRAQENFELTGRFLQAITPGLGLVFLCQPNNPTGRAIPRPLLLEILEACRAAGAVLMLDECFVPFLDDPAAGSLQDRLEAYPNLVLLRAFTKLYAMPGLRLGYAATADAALARDLLAAGQPWAVSGPAQAAGIAALREDDYVKKARALVRAERAFLLEGLRAAGAAELGGEANYLFFRSPDPALCEKLLPRGILLRDCANYRGLGPGYCRAAVRTHPENVRFLAAVQEILGNREI